MRLLTRDLDCAKTQDVETGQRRAGDFQMRYLLVGNGPAPDIANKAKHADAVIQINCCAHREAIAPEKMSHVCVVNTCDPQT